MRSKSGVKVGNRVPVSFVTMLATRSRELRWRELMVAIFFK
jgi:hypothetical protein